MAENVVLFLKKYTLFIGKIIQNVRDYERKVSVDKNGSLIISESRIDKLSLILNFFPLMVGLHKCLLLIYVWSFGTSNLET